MDPVLSVALGFGLFAASHIGLAWLPVRRFLVARLGRWGFTVFFTVVAWISFGAAISTYAAHAGEGPAGFALGAHAALRFALLIAIAVGLMLMSGAFGGYGRSPFPPSGEHVREPYGLERVTRHPFFVGLALLGVSHALLATRLVGAVAMGSLAGFALLGAWFQDRKLLALRGAPYADYLAATSTVPFAAIAAGRQRMRWAELPYGMLSLGLALSFALRAVHENLFARGGAYVIAVFVIGPLVILVAEWRRDRHAREHAPTLAEG